MFHLVFPWIFVLLPLPWLIARFFPPAAKVPTNALKVPFFQELGSLSAQTTSAQRNPVKRQWLLWLIWFLLLFSASNPQWLGEPIQIAQKGRDLMLAVDLSGSMEIRDMVLNDTPVDRLTALKSIAGQFIEARVGDRIGLILFGTHAYAQAPLTFDRTTVKNLLYDASISLAGPQTAIGDAIGLAVKRFKNSPSHDRVLILLTDGGNNSGELSPHDAAALAEKEHIKIYTIGFGNDEIMIDSILGPQAINPSADLDEDTLKTIAEKTHGQYFRAKDTNELKKIYAILNQLEPIVADDITYRPITWLYPWTLGLALFLSLGLAISRIHFSNVYHQLTRLGVKS